jgi:tRNA(fMet)-specific endonuclease VapC
MMPPSLLDTDTLSEVLRGKNSIMRRNAHEYLREHGRFSISTVTIVEMVKGFARLGREDQILALAEQLYVQEILSLDEIAATLAGRIYGELERSGQTIGRSDPMIAGIALRHGLTLATGSTEHFQRVVDLGFPLKLADWRI